MPTFAEERKRIDARYGLSPEEQKRMDAFAGRSEVEEEVPEPEEIVKSELTRRRVREMGAKEAYKQVNYLETFGEGVNLETFLDDLGKKPELWENPNAQKIAEIELKKRFGYIQSPQKAPQIYSMLRAQERAKTSIEQTKQQLSPGDIQLWGAEYSDAKGNPQYLELSRLKTERETPEAQQQRLQRGMEKVGTPEGVLETINILPEDYREALAHSELEWQLLQDLSTKAGMPLTFEEAITRTGTSEGRHLAKLAQEKAKRQAKVTLPLTKSLQGDAAIDVATSINRLVRAYTTKKVATWGKTWGQLTEEEADDLMEEARTHAKKRMREIVALNTGTLWVDVDPDGTTQKIINTPWWAGGRVLSPFRATWAGLQTQDQYFGRAPETLGKEGGLEWFGRQAFSTLWGAAIHTGCWGCDEHIQLIREGYDITDDFGNIAKILTPKALEREQLGSRIPEVTMGLLGTFGLIILDPDILTVPIFAAAKPFKALWKTGKIPFSKIRRFQKTEKLAREQSRLPDSSLLLPSVDDASTLEASIGTHLTALRADNQALGDVASKIMSAKVGAEPVNDVKLVHIQRERAANLTQIEKIDERIAAGVDRATERALREEKLVTEVADLEAALKGADISLRQAVGAVRTQRELLGVGEDYVVKMHGKPISFKQFTHNYYTIQKSDGARQLKYGEWLEKQTPEFQTAWTKLDLKPLFKADSARLGSGTPLDDVISYLKLPKKEGGLGGFRQNQWAAKNRRIKEVEGILAHTWSKSPDDPLITQLTELLRLPAGKTAEAITKFKKREGQIQALSDYEKLSGLMMSQDRLLAMRKAQAKIWKKLEAKSTVKPGKLTPTGKSAMTRSGVRETLKKAKARGVALMAKQQKAERGLLSTKEELLRRANINDLYRETMGEIADWLGIIVKSARKGTVPLGELFGKTTGGAEILAKATTKELDDFVREVDPVPLLKAMDEEFGEELLKQFMLQGGDEASGLGRVLTKIKDEGRQLENIDHIEDFAKYVDAAKTAYAKPGVYPSKVLLNGDDVADFQAGIEAMEIMAKKIAPKYAPERYAQALLVAMESPYLPIRYKATDPSTWKYASDLARTLPRLAAKFSPAKQRLGELGPEMAEVLKRSIQRRAKFDDELWDLIRLTPDGTNPLRTITKYLMSTNPMRIRNGWSSINTGSASIYRKGVEQIVQDERVLANIESLDDLGAVKALDAIARAWMPAEQLMPDIVYRLRKIAYNIIRKQYETDTLDFNSLMQEMKKAVEQSGGMAKKNGYFFDLDWRGLGAKTADNTDKAYSFGALGIGHAMILNEASRDTLKFVGGVTDQAAADLVVLIGGGPHKILKAKKPATKETSSAEIPGQGARLTALTWKGPKAVVEETDRRVYAALDAVGRYGISIADPSLAKASGRNVTKLVRISQNPDGINAFMPTTLISEIDDLAGKIVKETHKYNAPERTASGVGRAWNGYWRLYRTSLVSGLLVPNPRYWVNNIVGDFSQIWWGHGLKTTSVLSFQNFAMNMPWGRQLHNKQLQMQAKLGTKNVFASLSNAFFNPSLDKVWRAADDDLIQLGDRLTRIGTLRKEMDADGVMDTFVHASLKEAASKAARDAEVTLKSPNLAKDMFYGEMYSAHATFVQQRQRAAFYLEMRRQGMSRGEATVALRKALYDWKDPLTALELKFLAPYSTFYRFYRLMMKQVGSMLLEPITQPGKLFSKDTLKYFDPNRTALGRLRHMMQGTNVVGEATYWGSEQQQRNTLNDDRVAKGLREVGPWWNRTRPLLNSYPMDPMWQQWWEQQGKAGMTHEVTLMPQFTPLDGTQLAMTTLAGLVGVSAHLAGVPVVDDWTKQTYDPLVGLMLPPLSETLKGYLDRASGDSFWGSGALSTLRPGEAEAMELMSTLKGGADFLQVDPETKKVKAASGIVDAYRSLPFAGTQLPTFWAAAKNPGWAKSNSQGIWYAMRGLTSFKPYPINPVQEMEWGYERRKRAVTKELSAIEREAAYRLLQKVKKEGR